MSISAMKYALDVLDNYVEDPRCETHCVTAIHFLRQAIAEAEQPDLARVGEVGIWGDKREWVGFTHEELAWLNEALNLGGRLAVIEAIEAKLKEKNNG
jgi:hypothetical protein